MEGVCFHEGMALFVPYALPGEDISCRVVKVQKNHAFGKLLEIKPQPGKANTALRGLPKMRRMRIPAYGL
jgi:tRNA/tmRNA/rRNA uracil-C5-methylase (TrmA/RlmC/RlmD family)